MGSLSQVDLIGILIGIAGLALAVVFYRKSRRFRRLTCRFSTPIIVDLNPESIAGSARDKLKATFDGRPLSAISVIQATIRNEGTEPIEAKDIEEPVQFAFPNEVALLDSELVANSPKVVASTVVFMSDRAVQSWGFRSLDKGEYFTIQFLVEGRASLVPQVDARILGISTGVQVLQSNPRWEKTLAVVQMSFLAVLTAGVVTATFSSWLESRRVAETTRAVQHLNEAILQFDAAKTLLDTAVGRETFSIKCEICHDPNSTQKKIGPGLKGIGKGVLPSGKAASMSNLLQRLNGGGGGMPAFAKLLTDDEKLSLVLYLSTL